ncbi:MAG: amidohydrolase [Spirochaetaceae bacterium]|nr:amidohydrolase [Spirochaetaceae bacterium]
MGGMNGEADATAGVDARLEGLCSLSDAIWRYAETGFDVDRSAAALRGTLEAEGFEARTGIGGIDAAFMASWGKGAPVIALLGEYDALPGMSQAAASPQKAEVVEGGNGHGCGHNLLGVGSLGAALAAKDFLVASGLPGTVRYYGCPGEERGAGKTFMARAGAFDGVDLALTWHPGDVNSVLQARTLANLSAYFRFTGKAAHAANAPHLGRSALDAVELMNVGANYLREHVIPEARIHYAITNPGGRAPNVVQDVAESHYFCRAPRVPQAREIFARLCDVARGAALMTGTACAIRLSEGLSDYLPNGILGELLQRCMERKGTPAFSDEDRGLARRFRETFSPAELASALSQARHSQGAELADRLAGSPLAEGASPLFRGDALLPGSTDVGDVSQLVPTGQVICACAAFGTAPHTWQFTAQAASSIGHAGMAAAARVLALACAEIFADPGIAERAREELRAKTGGVYECPIPDDIQPGGDGEAAAEPRSDQVSRVRSGIGGQ